MPGPRVQLVDASAFTPPYDHALSAALARAGADVELVTSRFLYGPVPREDGYSVSERFYRRTAARGLDASGRRLTKLAEHVPDMRSYVKSVRSDPPDVLHWQWLTVPALDRHLIGSVSAPQAFTVHYPLAAHPRALARQRALLERMDAVVVHSEHGARRLREDVGIDPGRVHVIEHGAFDYLTRLPDERSLPEELERVEGPVILFFGLLRSYKGIDVLLDAFSSVDGAELWVVGRAMMDLGPLEELAAKAPGRVRFVPRFITDPEIPALMRRADILALPYREIEQSGVLYTGLAFGKPMVVSAIGGFTEVAERHGAARLVPPGNPALLAAALNELLVDPAARRRLGEAAAESAAGPYSWDAVAARTLSLYRSLLDA